MTFPKELERHFWRDADFTFLIIWFLTFAIINGTVGYMQTRPVRELTAEEIQKFNQAIFRIKVEQKKVEVVADESSSGVADVSGEEEVAEEATEVVQASAEEKRAVRESKKAARAAKAASRREAIANRIKILGGPTARSRSSRRGGASARAAVGLSGGSGGGVDLKNALAIVGGADAAAKVKSARGGGAASGDIGDISLGDLRGFLSNPDNLSAMLNEAPLKLNKRAITSRGKGSKKRQRSQKAITNVVTANKNAVQYCYWTYKRRDSNLKGQIVVEFTIAPAGEIKRVRFRKSDWGRNPLQKDVEKCIKNIIMQWRFDPIAESDGDVTAGATFIFE
ncbi:MAG: AgmX/PglI C-terminal domain-containing protein [Calditrichaeota bacterium]|nr:AgmX/PglI C-terminal domain-containing protein [Calditrichota bacterium]